MEFKDKIVVVTGGARGIGRAISLQFAREGARVFAAYIRNDETAAALIADAAGLPGLRPRRSSSSAGMERRFVSSRVMIGMDGSF